MKLIECDDDAHRMLAEAARTLIGAAQFIEHQIHGGMPTPGVGGTIYVECPCHDGRVEIWAISVVLEMVKPRGPTH